MEVNHTFQSAIEDSMEFLHLYSEVTAEDVENSRRKWDGFWWHMAALHEMGEVKRIPASAIAKAKYILGNHTWPVFVISTGDAPHTEQDKRKMDCCHCELAVYYMILMDYGCDLDTELPWIREWFLKHQLPDGGLNCEPEAYLHSRKSSLVSTLPPLEAVLRYTNREYTAQEANFLDEGARYLMEHRLAYTKKSGEIINEDWLKPCFPRFFEYDILRGMSFLVEWSRRRNKPLPAEVIDNGIELLSDHIDSTGLRIGRRVFDPSGPWGGHTFALLEAVSEVGQVSPFLTRQWNHILSQSDPNQTN
ncbi:hypothetical protein [Planococcus sp. CAU13]|uniref:hypothetical protein n=1 Tax=Planococcus sp. CAU13 TaxID=1541197 RepID=UPI00052FF2DA|nr:hypothetical protein [Planococcus sp. CAU13]